jgi:hypothetical protein
MLTVDQNPQTTDIGSNRESAVVTPSAETISSVAFYRSTHKQHFLFAHLKISVSPQQFEVLLMLY